MGKTYVGNSSGVAKVPKKIYAGNSSNVAKAVKVVYCGNSSGKAVEVWRNSTLPSTYQKVEYIYNTGGTQYINIGVKPNSDTTVETEFKYGLATYSTQFFGVGYSNQRCYEIFFSSSSSSTSSTWNFNDKTNFVNITRDAKHTLVFNAPGGKFYVDGSLKHTLTDTFSTMGLPILLFARYYSENSPSSTSGTIQIAMVPLYVYHFVVKQGNVMVRDMYPCYLKSNTQTVGMYDLANGQFYGNSGTGIFYKGPDVN